MAKTYKKISLTFVTEETDVKEMLEAINDMLDISGDYCSIISDEIAVTDAEAPSDAS